MGIEVSEAAARLIHGGARIQALLDDLLDFNRTRLGFGIKVAPTDVDLEVLFAHELDQVRAVHPDQRVELEVVGSVRGTWDGRRLQQLLGNLVLNAIKYGLPEAPVRVVVTGGETDVHIEVRNSGTPIERSTLDEIFEPLKRGPDHEHGDDADGSLGLGLYIAREIAKAHGGHIEARSGETETAFAVRLPRHRQSHS